MQHLIQRQTLELTLATTDQSQAIQEEIRHLLMEETMPEVDAVLSRFASDEQNVVFDRLNINVGCIAESEIEAEFSERVTKELTQELERRATIRLKKQQRPNRIAPTQDSKLKILEHFLRTGQFVWWATDASRFEPKRLLAEVLNESPAELLLILQQQKTQILANRLAKQFSTEIIERVLALAMRNVPNEIKMVVEEWTQVAKSACRQSSFSCDPMRWVGACEVVAIVASQSTTCERLNARLGSLMADQTFASSNECFTALMVAADRTLPGNGTVRHWIARSLGPSTRIEMPGKSAVSPDNSLHISTTDDALPDKPTQSSSTKGLDIGPLQNDQDELYSSKQNVIGPSIRTFRSVNNPADCDSYQGAESDKILAATTTGTLSKARQAPIAHNYVEGRAHAAMQDRSGDLRIPFHVGGEGSDMRELDCSSESTETLFYINNAGLILLWPFLPRFFASILLVRDKAFVSRVAQERAVLLSQYLVTGCTEAPEHLLVLNKLLCEYPPFESVSRELELADKERIEADDLLLSVVAHWKALKSTSIEGLRRSFLQRDGRLERREGGWDLTLERVGYDVLLDKLPWALGAVVLPWMKEPMIVEW